MSLPVRPPIPPRALEVNCPALIIAEPAEDVTLDSPSDAFDAAWEAFSFAEPATSEFVEALRIAARRTANCERRNTARDTARDIATRKEKEKTPFRSFSSEPPNRLQPLVNLVKLFS